MRNRYLRPTKFKTWILITIALSSLCTILLIRFFSEYKLQSPILFRSPITSRFVSPIPEDQVIRVIQLPKVGGSETSPSPTPYCENGEMYGPCLEEITPKPKRSLISRVEASEIRLDDRQIAFKIGQKDWDYDIAIRVAKSENAWNKTGSFDCTRIGGPNSNGTRDYGLFQINEVHATTLAKQGLTMDDMLDCDKNIEFAYQIYEGRQNWSAWSAYNNGSYLTHSIIEL